MSRNISTKHFVIYDGNCNLCSNLVQALEQIDRGDRFSYIHMQDAAALASFGITPQDCELGVILINAENRSQRWQGTAAAEEIARLLPIARPIVSAYRAIPGLKAVGDRVYEQVRDNRYALFGKREVTYRSSYPVCDDSCDDNCEPFPAQ